MSHRREFLKTLGATALAAGVAPRLARAASPTPPGAVPHVDAYAADLTQEALQAATENGASYADVRIARYRRQSVNTRERQVTGVSDSESYGVGVRALVNGAWGFAGTQDVTRDGVRKAALEATRAARAAKRVQRRPVELAPVTAVKGAWATPIRLDPFDVPIEDKVALLLAANEAALKVKGVRFATSGVAALREEKTLGTTDGTLVTQTFYRIAPSFTATALGNGDFQAYTEELAPRGSGWEYMQQLDLPTNAEKWAALAAEKLTARSVEVGRYDLILDPRNLWLTIHESVGHPTELDRAMGYEANYAGTSFVAPPRR
jgi:TldD protein